MADIDPGWWWAIGGVALLMAEILAPGFFLVFIGAAAIATGLFTVMFDLGTTFQLILFIIYTAVAVTAGRRFYNRPRGSSGISINDRSAQIVGRSVLVTAAVDAHHGRVRLADGEWSARGGPAAIGDRVTVRRIDGNCLIVESEAGGRSEATALPVS